MAFRNGQYSHFCIDIQSIFYRANEKLLHDVPAIFDFRSSKSDMKQYLPLENCNEI